MHILSRVADSIYWLNRYVERVENYARLIETYQQLSLENAEVIGQPWAIGEESSNVITFTS